MLTKQENFWSGDFGKDYTERNSHSLEDWNNFYLENWGSTRIKMNEVSLDGISKDAKILEVGCNTGMQLRALQKMGFENLYGVEIQKYAAERAKDFTKHVNIVQGSGFDLPFRDGYFDLVCTNGVLIHISPDDLPKIMDEMYRCTSKYIWGWEYFADDVTEINYRGNEGYLWKANYAQLFLERFSDPIVVCRRDKSDERATRVAENTTPASNIVKNTKFCAATRLSTWVFGEQSLQNIEDQRFP